MRALAVVLAVAATVSLSGCLWWAEGFEESGEDGSADPEVAFILLGGAVIVGIVLVAINLSNAGGSQPPPPPLMPARPPQPPVSAGWQQVEEIEPDAPAAPRPAARSAPKPARRRAP
jgi:hypothetical protein